MKIGDQVRFLSETGGGVVAGFKGKDIVLVEDEDGFQIPTSVREVVVVHDEDYSTANVVSKKAQEKPGHAAPAAAKEPQSDNPADRPVTFRKKPEERKGGD